MRLTRNTMPLTPPLNNLNFLLSDFYFLLSAFCFLLSAFYFLLSVCYGTGSYPEPPQGWQRSRRRIVRYNPLIAPCFLSASIAYCEQVGVKRHEGGFSGDIQS